MVPVSSRSRALTAANLASSAASWRASSARAFLANSWAASVCRFNSCVSARCFKNRSVRFSDSRKLARMVSTTDTAGNTSRNSV